MGVRRRRWRLPDRRRDLGQERAGNTAFTLARLAHRDTHLPQAPVGHPGHTDDHGYKWPHTLPPGSHQVRVYGINTLGGIVAGPRAQFGGTYSITMR